VDRVLFEEKQRFVGRGVAGTLLALGVVAFGFAVREALVSGRGPDWVIAAAAAIVGVGLPWLFYRLELTVLVLPDRFEVQMPPLTHRVIPLAQILRSEAMSYRPLRDYGGWGLRCGSAGRAYTVRGDRGVQVELVSGETFLVGSGRAEELAQILGTAKAGHASGLD